MTRWIGIKESGELVRDTETDVVPEQTGITFVEVAQDFPVNITAQYWAMGAFVGKGKAPLNHTFDYALKQWVLDSTTAIASVKQRRDRLLSSTDWQVTKATETGQPVPLPWLSYRQALRDITLQVGYPFTVIWPVLPGN